MKEQLCDHAGCQKEIGSPDSENQNKKKLHTGNDADYVWTPMIKMR